MEVPLESIVPSIYHLARRKDGSVHHHYFQSGEWINWHLHLRRNLSDWEVEQVAELMLLLENLKVNSSGEDESLERRLSGGVFGVFFL